MGFLHCPKNDPSSALADRMPPRGDIAVLTPVTLPFCEEPTGRRHAA
jgi:hypothetical protein